MNRDEWLALRRQGIGGSDAPAVLGVSKWKSPFQLWQEKRGELAETPDNWSMRWGRTMEPELRQHYSDVTGRQVLMVDGVVRHPRHEWMLCTPDGGTDDGRLVEIKTARTMEGWGEPGTDQIPQAYLIQVQHSLCVTAMPIADVVLGLYGQEPMMYHVEADAELHDMLIDVEREFWRSVQEGIPPEPSSYADVVARWGRGSHHGGEIEAHSDLIPALNALSQAKKQRAELQEIEESAKAQIMKFMGDHNRLVDAAGYTICTWASSKPVERFDVKAFRAAHPELYKQFTNEGEAIRRFLLK